MALVYSPKDKKSTPLRMAIFSDCFYPELGGIQDSILLLAKKLGELGHQIEFFVPRYTRKNFVKANFPVKEIDLGPHVKVTRLWSVPLLNTTEQSRLVIPTGLRFLKVKKFKPDIIYTNTFLGLGLEALCVARFLRVPIVGTSHLAISEFGKYIPLPENLYKKYSRRFVAWYYNHCDLVTAPSQSVFDEMISDGLLSAHQVISNPIDTETFLPDKNVQKLPHSLCFAGRFSPEKHIDILIRAVAVIKKQFPDVVLSLAGHGSEKESLEKLCQDLGVQKNVHFLGTLSKPQLAKLYNSTTLFTIASTCETQGLVMMQAFACGVPTVGVRSRALAEYITPENGVLVEPGDFEGLAQKVICLFQHPEEISRLGTGAHQFAQAFSLPQVAHTWENVFESLLKK